MRAGVAAAAVAALAAGCTAGAGTPPGGGGRNGPGASGPAAGSGPAATVSAPDNPTAVVDGATPGALSVAVSAELFDSAPVVVVASAGDPAGIGTAAAEAERLGAPLLLKDADRAAPAGPAGSATPAGPSTPAGPTTPATPGAPADLAAEIRRLRPRAVLAVGTDVASGLGALGDIAVVTDPGRLPAVSRPAGLADLSVLVRAGGGPVVAAGASAAAATARAAGASVVPVRGTDPRSDPAAIKALAAAPPRHVLGAGRGFGPADRLAARVAVAATGRQLPAGGQTLFPGRRLIALYGHPGTGALGVLGEQPVGAAITRAARIAAPYRRLSDVPVVPAFEIIATVAQSAPGGDGSYSFETPVSLLRPWVERAGAAGMYVVLDLQPGRSNFLSQAKLYEKLLTLPYVGLALDPEWRLAPGQKPLQQIGGVDAREVNSVVTWLADLTAKNRLPQKLLVLHQFRLSMLRDERTIDTSRDELALLIHMDGQGAPSLKDQTWGAVTAAAPRGLPFGWKNFYDEDKPMLSPAQTMTKRPTPVMISYQ